MEFLKTLFVLTSQVRSYLLWQESMACFYLHLDILPQEVFGAMISFLKEILSVEFCSVLG